MACAVVLYGGDAMTMDDTATLYRYRETDGGYDRFFIPACYWMETRGASVTTGAVRSGDAATIYIPEAYARKVAPQRDLLVRGNCSIAFDNSSPATISASLAELSMANEVVTAVEVIDRLHGHALRHIEVHAK